MPATTRSQDGRAQSEGFEHDDPEQLSDQSNGDEEMEEIEARESRRVERRQRSYQDACDSIAAKMSKVWQSVRAIESSPMDEQAQAELSAALNAVKIAGIPLTAIPLHPVPDAELLEAVPPTLPAARANAAEMLPSNATRDIQLRSYRLREYCKISHDPDGVFDSESGDDLDDEFVSEFLDEQSREPKFEETDEVVKLALTAIRSVPNAYLAIPILTPDYALSNEASVSHYHDQAIHPASECVVVGILGRGSMTRSKQMHLRHPSRSIEDVGGGVPDEVVQCRSILWSLLRTGTIYEYKSPGTLKKKHFKNNHPVGRRILLQVCGYARALQALHCCTRRQKVSNCQV